MTHTSDAQSLPEGTITGTVTSFEENAPLPGVNVVEKGTTNGTITDIEGQYSIVVPSGATLLFSSIGYLSQEVQVGSQTTLNATLQENVQQLDELVVVGYGTQKKSDLTGSIARVSGEDIRLPSTANFDQMLQGKVPGVQVSLTSGAPGGGANILVRGVSSITGGNQPLYVIDGYPIDPGGGSNSDLLSFGDSNYSSAGMANNTQNRINPLTFINPADIESIDVLKDASATAIYGSRGANGVVIITTKRGSYNQSQIKLDVSYGVQEVANKVDLMNAQQYAEFLADGRDNAWVYAGGSATDPNDGRTASTQVRPEFRNPESIAVNTDWQDVIFRVAPVQNYQISANTGNDKTKFYLSGGYFNQQGVIRTSEFQRFNLRSNIDAQLTDKLTIGTSLTGSHGFGRYPNTEGHYGTGNVLMAALAASPTIPVYDENGGYFFDQADVIDGLGWLANPLAMLEGYTDDRKITDILSNNFIEYSILDGLTLKSSLGIQYGTNVIKLWRSSEVPFFTTLNYPATAGVTKTERINWLNENTLTYRRVFNEKHSLDALIGFTSQKDSYDRLSAGASDFPTNYVTYLSAGIVNSGTHLVSEWAMLSLMSRINYAYDSKYLLTATIRRDGSSRFGRNRQWGTFPSFSVGYNVSEEAFMENIDVINSLKLRASYGLSGNNQIGNFTHIGLLSTINYVDNNSLLPGLVPASLANDELTWEISRQVNLGLDMSLFSERLSLTADLYRDLKTDLLLAVELPAASGFNSSTQNIGDIENKGIELGLQTVNVQSNQFVWSSNIVFSANRNKVLKLAAEGGRISNSSFQITQVGDPISSFYLLNAVGVFENEDEVEGAALQHPNTQAGDLKFEDVNEDGVINATDRKIVGTPWPDYTWGFTNRFTYKNLSLSVSLNGSQGASSYFQAGQTILNAAGVQNQVILADRRWRSPDSPGDGLVPRAIRNNYANGFGPSSRFLFDASFTRIREVNLTYRLPQTLASRLSVQGLTVFANVINLHTFTSYPGFDPESSTAGDNVVNTGIDYLTYPLPRTYTFGLNLTF